MEAQSAISFQRVIITNSKSYLQHLSPVIFYQENPVSKLIQGPEKANKSRCKNSLRDCFCDFSIKFARKRAHWERPCNPLGMNALMFSAKCAFGICAIWGTDCFEAYRQQPCLLGREVITGVPGWVLHTARKSPLGAKRRWMLSCLVYQCFGYQFLPFLLFP